MSVLRTASSIDQDPAAYVRRHGTVRREFGPPSQDSGNVSWLVDTPGGRLFVKTAGVDGPPPPGDWSPYFDHAGRVALLRTAVELARSCPHPALPALLNVIESPAGPLLVYEAAAGELVHARGDAKADPGSAYQRFARLPAGTVLGVFDVLIDLHRALAAVGWVAVDLYDGCLIVHFGTGAVRVVDLDTYRRGPSVNEMGRMFGSSTFMAPEEFVLGATIDERTTVFTLGRLVWHFATRLTERAETFCGPPELASVVRRACAPTPDDRYPSVADLADAWVRERRPAG